MHNETTTDISTNIACTLVPVKGYQLLIPNQCIAEIVMRSDIKNVNSTHPWCDAEIFWLGRKIPIIHFDNQQKTINYTAGNKSMIVVIEFPFNKTEHCHFGILANHTPQVIPANNQTLDRELNPGKTHDYAVSYVVIKGKSALIPDLQRITASLQNSDRKSA